jgi:flagellar biosynthesis protein FliP
MQRPGLPQRSLIPSFALASVLVTAFSNLALAQSSSTFSDSRPPSSRDSGSNDSVSPLLKAASDSLFGQRRSAPANPNDPSNGPEAEKDAGLLEGPAKWVSPEGLNGSLQILLLLTVLSLAPAILLMTTCYVRIIVVMGLLRQALGAAQLPPSQVITSISLFVTLFVMAPVWSQVYDDAIKPYTAPKSGMTMEQAWEKGVSPIRTFMSRQIHMAGNYDDVMLFYNRHSPNSPPPSGWDDVPLTVLLPAYMLSELKTSFMMGFQIYLPFLILDIVIASVTISMGMMMLPPAMISMPFKLLLFVLVDGWRLVVQMLLDSFGTYGT